MLSPNDKEIWDEAYKEEYEGLNSQSTWGLITHQQYEALRPLYGNVLPSMALATIKYNETGQPNAPNTA